MNVRQAVVLPGFPAFPEFLPIAGHAGPAKQTIFGLRGGITLKYAARRA